MVKPDLIKTHNNENENNMLSMKNNNKDSSSSINTSSLQSATPGHFGARRRAGFRFCSHTHSPQAASLHLEVFAI